MSRKSPKREPLIIDRPREGESDEAFKSRFSKSIAKLVIDSVNEERARLGKPPLKKK